MSHNKTKTKVLLVDDSLESRILVRNMFQDETYSIDTAINGFDAVNKMGETQYDLVILDWNMPRRDGKETLKVMEALFKNKVNENSAKIPLVLYTGVSLSNIDLPSITYFQLIDHWNKTGGTEELYGRVQYLKALLKKEAA